MYINVVFSIVILIYQRVAFWNISVWKLRAGPSFVGKVRSANWNVITGPTHFFGREMDV